MIKKVYLVVDAEGEARLVKRAYNIRAGEAAFELRINVPRGWGSIIGSIDIAIPEPPSIDAVAILTSSLAPTPSGDVTSEEEPQGSGPAG